MVLKINNLSKSFADRVILDNFSYSFSENGIYLITGESGIGKTTLLRIIAGLDKDFVGEIENGGFENVSFMFQEYRLFPTLNAVKNAASSYGKLKYSEAEEMLTRLGFKADDLTKKPRELSGGMKQRVSFVRAMLKDSPIILLDEPTKELDPHTADIMLDIIREESERRLIIAVTHDDISEKLGNAQTIHLQ